jgi:hypothetical protein
MKSILGFFYLNYNSKYYYMEIIWLLRNFTLTASITLVPDDKSVQGTAKY